MKRLNLLFCAFAAVVALQSCGGSDNTNNRDYEYIEDESVDDSYALDFKNSQDVCSYLNGKTFKGDGLSVTFSNNAQTVFVNGKNISNDVRVSDPGVNVNNVAYATVKIINVTGITTTLTLLAVKDHAQLIDPNDGTIYEY